ncbi:MAG: M28 family metallopeptidase [Allosphingosinicella sp.]|uniref:M28 family metallopeptidase n=1 Tax=Allosphingosinicella sp. TaxID=2823234 RepID=UPI003953CB7A
MRLSQLDGSAPAGFAAQAGGGGPALWVTADARLGRHGIEGGGRRIQHEVLLAALAADPQASFRYFHLRPLKPRLADALATIEAAEAILVYRSASGDLIGIAEDGALTRLLVAGWPASRLGAAGLPDTHDLYLMRDADAAPEGFATEAAAAFASGSAEVLVATDEGLVVAIPASGSIEDFHFPVTRHGHNLKLLPDPALVRPLPPPSGFAEGLAAHEPTAEVADALRALIEEERLATIVSRLSGAVPVGAAPISSRHVHHPDCDRAVEEIAHQLADLGLRIERHRFVHEGRTLANITADLKGTGEGLVFVTAHLDSRAGRGEPDYQPDRDEAPGADDDASGVAAAIVIARALTELAREVRPYRTVRFAFFHAEEHGLVGSRHYARAAAAAGLPIEAVLQMDMIGYVPAGTESWRVEVHIGHRSNPAIEQRSRPIATLLEACARLAGTFDHVEVYRSPDDPTQPGDPADGRSDHSSFHMSGFPAAIISEDFFGGTVAEPDPDPNNPQYHSRTDTSIDAGYATAVARTVALAAWTIACRGA